MWGTPLQVSLRLWSPCLTPLDPATGTVIIAEAIEMSPVKAETPRGSRGGVLSPAGWEGFVAGCCPSATRQALGSWGAGLCSIRPVWPLRTGTLLYQGSAMLAGGSELFHEAWRPQVAPLPSWPLMGPPVLQRLVHVSPLVANSHQMGRLRCLGQHDMAPNTYSQPPD